MNCGKQVAYQGNIHHRDSSTTTTSASRGLDGPRWKPLPKVSIPVTGDGFRPRGQWLGQPFRSPPCWGAEKRPELFSLQDLDEVSSRA